MMMEEGGNKRLRDASIENLEEELRKRQRQPEEGERGDGNTKTSPVNGGHSNDNDAPVEQYGPHAGSLSLVAAIDQLRVLFNALVEIKNEDSNYVFPSEHALFLLKTHPSIVKEPFLKRTVLSFFLQAKSPLPIVKEICEIRKNQSKNSQSEYQQHCFGFYRPPNAIGDACLHGRGAEGVLQYLLQQFPDQILQRDGKGRIPLDLLLNRMLGWAPDDEFEDYAGVYIHRKETYPTMQSLLTACPRMFEYCRNGSLYLAKLVGGGRHAITSNESKILLFERFGQASNVETLVVSDEAGPVCSHDIFPISRVLPHLKVFRFLPRSTTVNCYRDIIGSLYSMHLPNLVELGLSLDSGYMATGECNGGVTLGAIQNCHNLKKLALKAPSQEALAIGDPCMHLCINIVKQNPGIESMELFNFRTPNTAALSEFFSHLSNVKNLTLDDFQIESRWCICQQPENSNLANLELSNVDLKSEWLNGLLLQIIKESSSLEHLKLGHNSSDVVDLTAVLAAVLKEDRIDTFEVTSECSLAMHVICEGFASNKSLGKLLMRKCNSLICAGLAHTLEHENVFLNQIGARFNRCDEVLSAFWEKILHYGMLNRYSRAELQGAEASLEVLLENLGEIAEALDINYDTLMRHNTQMGLLHLAPAIWAVDISSEK